MRSTPARKELKQNGTGSPDQGESVFILIGKIQRSHGVEGDVLVHSISDAPERFAPGTTVWVGEEHQEYRIQSRRFADRTQIIHFRGIKNPEEVAAIRNKLVYIQQSSLPPLPEGEYYHFQLIGLTVEDESGVQIGVLNEVLTTGANDVYAVLDAEGKEILFPAVESVVILTDIANKKMVVRPQEWL
jgi:16S rRNA processing protein RimM